MKKLKNLWLRGEPKPFFVLGLILMIALGASPAQAFVCSEVRLMDASGVIGSVHSYTFSAKCSWSATETKKSFGIEGYTSTSKHYAITMDVIGKGKWDRKTGKASEKLQVKGSGAGQGASGSFTGEHYASGICNEDPFLKNPPGGSAVCQGMELLYKGTSGPVFSLMVDPKAFLLAKKIALVEAQALSAKKPAGAPPPPPPKSQPKKEPLKIGDAQGAPGGVKAAPGPVVALAKPNLGVVASRANVEPNCQSPQPAMTVKVTIRNSGGPLPANKGTVFVKEFGGSNLGSGGVILPALGPGQEHTVSLPVISTQPYSSLAGRHKLQVIFNPQIEGGQATFGYPATPFVVEAAFPPNHCSSASRQSTGSSGNAAERRGVLPAPSPTPPRLPKR